MTRSESALDGGDCEDYIEAGFERVLASTYTAIGRARNNPESGGVRDSRSKKRAESGRRSSERCYWALDGVERLHCRAEEAVFTGMVILAHCVVNGGGSESERSLAIESD
ncbi:hypothetical protein F441_22170 [Phytophthora nicotianae CJ01A1]|uniref:Uncharacterized protein n=2 Tax=Phytophthora nicotianae TaxID=4792 RepID=W2VSR4_PHYNI|nr:hypothetical protein L916_21529 [Phytophthora nicotianae]ETP00414.1 hypothetical protein F441_22170 [Phytophthora nicotianae CJ01A1]